MRYLTAGESHGPRLTAIIEGVPAGLPLSEEDINKELKRRQGGYGRGARMKIEDHGTLLLLNISYDLIPFFLKSPSFLEEGFDESQLAPTLEQSLISS